MMKLNKLFLGAVSLLLVPNLVSAKRTCEDINIYGGADFMTNTGYVMKTDNGSSNYHLFTLRDEEAAFAAFCRNAGYSGGKASDKQQFVCKEVLFDTTTDNETQKAYDAGILSMLKSYENSGKSTDSYVATNLALRTYEMYWKTVQSANGANGTGYNHAHQYYNNLWLEDSSIKGKLEKISSYGPQVRLEAYSTAAKNVSWEPNAGSIESSAKSLVSEALDASIDYLENGAASLTWNEKPIIKTNKTSSNYTATVEYTLKVKNFKSSDAFIKIKKLGCSNCNGVSMTATADGSSVSEGSSLLNGASSGEKDIKLVINLSAPLSYNCGGKIKLEIELEYYDESISTEAFTLKSAACSSSSNDGCQEFYLLYKEDATQEAKLEADVDICKERKDNNCQTIINNAYCSKDDSEIDVKEGYEVDQTSCSIKSEDENIIKCIIDGEDDNGDSYELTKKIKNNKYCKVFCKEDYKLTLPGQKDTISGRYFTLEASVEGAERCYTGEITDRKKFLADLDVKRKEIIDAWNIWNKWYQGSISTNNHYRAHTASDHSCYDPCTVNEEPTCCGRCSCDVKYDGWYRTWNYIEYTYDGTPYNMPATDSRDGGDAYCNCQSGGGTDGTIENIQGAIEGDEGRARQVLLGKIAEYIEMLNEYNKCSGIGTVEHAKDYTYKDIDGWKMSFEYDPELKYYYEEEYMGLIKKDENKMQEVTKSTTDVEQNICTGDVNDSYKECKNSSWISTIDKTKDTVPSFLCKENGEVFTCTTEKIVVSSARYVKQEMKGESSYKSPVSFYTQYPTGAVSYSTQDLGNSVPNISPIKDTSKKTGEEVGGLPVGLGTKQGVYDYAIKISNVGNYFSKDGLGRIMGADTNIVTTVQEGICKFDGGLKGSATVKNETISNGVYTCGYTVNCPDCPAVCDPEPCEIPGCGENSCPITCDNCIYTNGKTNTSYKPISSGNINPNNRVMGLNWRADKETSALSLKAYVTTYEIQKSGEEIYDINYEDKNYDIKDIDRNIGMQVKLDSSTIQFIRKYNSGKTYADNTLTCYDYGKEKNTFCYSEFIDELIKEKPNNVKITGGERLTTDAERKLKSSTSGYWVTWSEAMTSPKTEWQVTNQFGLDYKEIGIGPSWK